MTPGRSAFGTLAETLDSVVNDREEVVITRAGHDPVVMVSLDDYQSLKGTAYLLRSPENARQLISSIERLENGGGSPNEAGGRPWPRHWRSGCRGRPSGSCRRCNVAPDLVRATVDVPLGVRC
ncbi:MAG: type II toxin-antitoxin system prevent-host-death family antitoxin [Actinophytocola sp.]|nr:type II toxin-antitoxin system prevent-host-death family antitoxin [Actinophytocola sp.]